MSVELIRVERRPESTNKESVAAGLLRRAKERPYLAAAVVPVALLATKPIIIASSVALAGAVIGGGEWRRQKARNAGMTVLDPEEARGFRVLGGEVVQQGAIYARHPKPSKQDLLIPAKRLHQVVVNEQIADLVSYLRSTVRVSRLDIYIKSDRGLNVSANGVLKAVPFRSRITGRQRDETAFHQTFDRPGRPLSNTANYVWLDDFPHIQAAAQNARHGSMKVAQAFDFSFGIEADAARLAGIKAEWLSTYTFQIDADFA